MTADTSIAGDIGRRSMAGGLTTLAGLLLVVGSTFQILDGVTAVFGDHLYVSNLQYSYQLDVTTWGWIHLIMGLVAFGTGIGLVVGYRWAYIIGIADAGLNAVTYFAFIPHYPVASMLVIAIDVAVIWALSTQIRTRAQPPDVLSQG
jgi:hypothetical protein